LINQLNNIIFSLNNTIVHTVDYLSQLAINEIYFFEFFIRGGKNLHILPNILKNDKQN
jgi:hypothetical protein